jgi:hypothetical protein
MATTIQTLIQTNGSLSITVNHPVTQEEFLRQAKEIIATYGEK